MPTATDSTWARAACPRTRKRYAKSTKTSTPQSTGNPASDCSLSAEEANVEKEQERESKQSSLLVSMVIWIGSLVGDRIPPFLGGYDCILIAHDQRDRYEKFNNEMNGRIHSSGAYRENGLRTACHAVYVLIARSRCIPKGATMVACFSLGRPWDRIPGLREDSILLSTPLG